MGRNEKFENEQREECIKKGWEPLGYDIDKPHYDADAIMTVPEPY